MSAGHVDPVLGVSREEELLKLIAETESQNQMLEATLKNKEKSITSLRKRTVAAQVAAEQEEEKIGNRLLKRLDSLERENSKLTAKVRKEEASSAEVKKALAAVRKERVKIENDIEVEQELMVNQLHKQLLLVSEERTSLERKLRAERAEVLTTLKSQLAKLGLLGIQSPALNPASLSATTSSNATPNLSPQNVAARHGPRHSASLSPMPPLGDEGAHVTTAVEEQEVGQAVSQSTLSTVATAGATAATPPKPRLRQESLVSNIMSSSNPFFSSSLTSSFDFAQAPNQLGVGADAGTQQNSSTLHREGSLPRPSSSSGRQTPVVTLEVNLRHVIDDAERCSAAEHHVEDRREALRALQRDSFLLHAKNVRLRADLAKAQDAYKQLQSGMTQQELLLADAMTAGPGGASAGGYPGAIVAAVAGRSGSENPQQVTPLTPPTSLRQPGRNPSHRRTISGSSIDSLSSAASSTGVPSGVNLSLAQPASRRRADVRAHTARVLSTTMTTTPTRQPRDRSTEQSSGLRAPSTTGSESSRQHTPTLTERHTSSSSPQRGSATAGAAPAKNEAPENSEAK